MIFSNSEEQAIESASKVRLLLLDVDGILTDGRLYFSNSGEESKAFHSLDGHGIKMLMLTGIPVGIITGRESNIVTKRAADLGIDAICLSNHGGRQLEGSPAPVSLVAPVAQEIQGRSEIICDGGIRRGSDILKAVALGATATMGGRAYLFGLGAAGERGVDTALGFLQAELARTMALNGLTSFDEVGPHIVAPA